jgi:hypothetical protein
VKNINIAIISLCIGAGVNAAEDLARADSVPHFTSNEDNGSAQLSLLTRSLSVGHPLRTISSETEANSGLRVPAPSLESLASEAPSAKSVHSSPGRNENTALTPRPATALPLLRRNGGRIDIRSGGVVVLSAQPVPASATVIAHLQAAASNTLRNDSVSDDEPYVATQPDESGQEGSPQPL